MSLRKILMAEHTLTEKRLLGLLKEKSFQRGDFLLTSGKKTDYLIDCKPAILTARGHGWAADCILHTLQMYFPVEVDVVAGVELGGCPLASAVAAVSYMDALYIRKTPKGHGSGKQIEGTAKEGSTVILLEDVVTTGGSSLKAIEVLRRAPEKFRIAGILALVDRLEGASEAFAQAGLPFRSIFTRRDFLPGVDSPDAG